MSKKYVLLSAFGHALLFASIAFPAHASRTPASEKSCQELIDADLAPFREQVRAIWVTDNLFIYFEIARIFSHELLDGDPGLRAKINDYKQGKPLPSDGDLQSLLNARADQTSGFADSLSRRFGNRFNYHWYQWHYPVIHVGDRGALRITFALPVDEFDHYELQMELGASSDQEDLQLLASATRIVALRSGVLLPHAGMLSPQYSSEKEFLLRHESTVRSNCLTNLAPQYSGLDFSLPAHTTQSLYDEPSSRGYWENHWITGYPTSNFSGSGSRAGGAQGGVNSTASLPGSAPEHSDAIDTPPATGAPVTTD